MIRMLAATLGALLILATPSWAKQDAWIDIKDAIFGDQFLLNGEDFIDIIAPYRASDDGRVTIGANISMPEGDLVKTIQVILDNNPVPVSAVFTLATPRSQFSFDTTMRINGPTPLHITAQTHEGKVFVVDTFVKTSGLGACSAPPGTDADAALATLGDMLIEFEDAPQQVAMADQVVGLSSSLGKQSSARVALSHPSHSGLQMDQITLLFLPMRAVQTLDVESDSKPYLNVEGSISLSENPEVSFSIPSNTFELGVTMTDTDGAVSTETKSRLVQ